MVLNGVQDFFQGKMYQALVWPITPMALLEGIYDQGDDYLLSRYICGMPGDVVFSRTLKCKPLFDHSLYNVKDQSHFCKLSFC